MIMNDPSFDSPFDAPDVDVLSPEAISLTSTQIQQAIQLSQGCSEPDRQWQAYLGTLAQIGFAHWLQERSPDLAASIQPKPLPQDFVSSIPLSLLQVGDYTLCLLTVSSAIEDRITIPITVVNETDYIPHFYVLIEVWEEQDYVSVYGYLCRNQIAIQKQTVPPSTGALAAAWLYLDWFDSNVDTLLLYLRCLHPDAILSTVTHDLTSTQDSIAIQDSTAKSQLSHSISHIPTINVGCWLRDRLDDVAQELSWVLLPPLAVTFRDTIIATEQFDSVTMALLKQGIAIPSHARGAYQNLVWEDVALRLYVVTWQEHQSTQAVQEWSLLLVLGAQSGDELPVGIRLIVEDNLQQLDEQILRERQPDAFLFTRVIGAWNEQFKVTIAVDNDAIIRLPPFRFQPND